MSGDTITALDADTWPLFADFFERQGGLFGGCWCVHFHHPVPGIDVDAVGSRAAKEQLVRRGDAHAALVVRDGQAIAWAQYGAPAELPNLHHRTQYDVEKTADPDWRVTCIQVLRTHRRQGLAEVALRGALELIEAAGGGVVEGYPHDMALKAGRKTSSSFLYNGTRAMYERVGFAYDRPKGQFNCVMRTEVAPGRPTG